MRMGAREDGTRWGGLVGDGVHGRVGNIGEGGPRMVSYGSMLVGHVGVAEGKGVGCEATPGGLWDR